ncbi:ATP-binding protein [Methanospirillum stamsii]|uniref:histidine kinase n=1 Tax=Methanospirillum stamsii TaxID=1277351 RepID=A0A2V2NHS6_9EURY|nr:ATP-binding protein [Methanospirillum stamsii]PWR75928.1 histidine kinase [Methanospirillum stamsii]
MDTVTILGLFCITSAIITYGLGIFVCAKNPDNRVNRLFLLVSIGASYWAIGEFLIWNQNSYENVWFWLKASSLWALVIVMCIHFILAFADHPLSRPGKVRYLLVILYLPAICIALLNVCTESIFTVGYSPSFRYYYTPVLDNPIYLLTTVYFLSAFFWGLYVGFKARISAGKDRFKRQASTISVGLLILIVLGSQSVIFLPMFGIYVPNLVFIGIVLFSIAIAYAILRYGLFILNPETVASNIIQTMPDGVILLDMDGNVISSNNSSHKLLSHFWQSNPGKFTGPPLPEPAYTEIREIIREKSVLSDYEIFQGIHDQQTLSISGTLVTDPYGEPAGMILIIHDITERKITEKVLRLANEKISLLNRLTRHDISNLITALAGYLEVLKDEEDETTRMRMLSVCIGLVDKITHHLQFSREYQNIGVHEPFWQSLREMTEKAVSDIHHENVDIIVDIGDVEIYADPLSIKVIYNLLENAIRHATGLTWIRVHSAEENDGTYMVSIEDNGPGISQKEKEKIFDQGYGKNTGFGLTLSRDILAVTGISIIENGEEGKGARFEVTIPSESWRNPVLES